MRGVEPAGGYEVQFFDWEENAVLGGHPWGYNGNLFAWREVFDFTSKTVGGKLSIYTNPAGNAWKEVDEAEAIILETDQELVLAHAGATDAMLHLKGEGAVLKVLIELDARLEAIRRRYEKLRGGLRRLRSERSVRESLSLCTVGKVRLAHEHVLSYRAHGAVAGPF